jgi:prolyl-tRNA editing enzyme YbaK/EbsC (Cys-tRNA(Pro) deacylase)
MKLPPHIYLEERNIPYEAKSFSPETEKGAANVAHALDFSERQAVKTLIFQVDTGERVLVMLGGDQNAISGNLKKAIGSRNIRMAPSQPFTGSHPVSDPFWKRVSSMSPCSVQARDNGARRS